MRTKLFCLFLAFAAVASAEIFAPGLPDRLTRSVNDLAAVTASNASSPLANRVYYDTISADRSFTLPSATAGDYVLIYAIVTTPVTITTDAAYRTGEASTITSFQLNTGNHVLNWRRVNSQWKLTDTGGMLNNFAGTQAPTADDDGVAGYSAGSLWVDVTNKHAYQCVDATATAAVWRLLDTPRLVTFYLTVDALAEGMNYGLGFAENAFTISRIRAVHVGTTDTPSILLQVYHGTDRSSGTAVVTAGTTVTSATTGSNITTFDSATVAAGSFLWITTASKSGTTDKFEVIVEGSYD